MCFVLTLNEKRKRRDTNKVINAVTRWKTVYFEEKSCPLADETKPSEIKTYTYVTDSKYH